LQKEYKKVIDQQKIVEAPRLLLLFFKDVNMSRDDQESMLQTGKERIFDLDVTEATNVHLKIEK